MRGEGRRWLSLSSSRVGVNFEERGGRGSNDNDCGLGGCVVLIVEG